MKRIILSCILGVLLTAGAGCGLMQCACYNRSYNDCGDCDDGMCDEGCGPTCGPARRSVCRIPPRVVRPNRGCVADCDVGCECGQTCGSPCESACGCDACDECCEPCGSNRCWNRGPFTWVFALFTPACWHGDCGGCGRFGCRGGCGERYWGNFYGDPSESDPCGNGVGRRCGCLRCRHGVRRYAQGYDEGGYVQGGGYDEGYPVNEQVVGDRVVGERVIGEQVSGERVIGDAPASSAAGQTYSSGSAQPHRATRSPQQ